MKVIRLTLCGPSDVAAEIKIAQEIIEHWNRLHCEFRGLTIRSRHWQTDTYPDASQTSQGAINKQIIDKANIIVAISWSRIGTPTAFAESGTIEEIQRGIALGRKVLVYFSDLESVVPHSDRSQTERLTNFRREMRKRNSSWSFQSRAGFRKDFADHLALVMNAFEPITNRQQSSPKRPRKKVIVKGSNSGIAAETITNHGTMAGTIKLEKLPKGPIQVVGSLVTSVDHYGYIEHLIKRLAVTRLGRSDPVVHRITPAQCDAISSLTSGGCPKIFP